MNYRSNVIFSYASRFINAALAIIVIPIYVSIFGLDEYGVIGFYLLMLSLSQFLDIGLSSTFSREIALSKDDIVKKNVVAINLKFVLAIFLIVSFLIATTFYFNSKYVTYEWLDTSGLDQKSIVNAISLIGIIVSIKLLSGPIRSIFVGMQELVILHKINITFSLLRYLGVLPFLMLYNDELMTYFIFQFFVTVLEFLLLTFFSLRYLDYLSPKITLECIVKHRNMYYFAFKVAISSWLWIAISQIDKVLLSKNLMIEDFSIFTMAMTITSSLLLFSAPLSQAILPKLAQEFKMDTIKYYETFDLSIKNLFNYIAFVPVFLYFFYQEIVYSWIGNVHVIQELSVYLPNYIISTSIVMIINCFYLLQHSQGDIKWHNRMHGCLLVFFVILMPMNVKTGGAHDMSIIWLCGAVFYMIIGGKIVFERFHKSRYLEWLLTHVAIQFLVAYLVLTVVYKFSTIFLNFEGRIETTLILTALFITGGFVTICINKKVSTLLTNRIRVIKML